jgi:hypothetical protein
LINFKCYLIRSIDTKVYHIQNEMEATKFLFQISQHKLNETSYHNIRPYLVAQKYEYIAEKEEVRVKFDK